MGLVSTNGKKCWNNQNYLWVKKMAGTYDKALKICEKYLSKGAKNFLDRQITMHLNKTNNALDVSDKTELAKWCNISGALLLGKQKAEQLSAEILSI